MIPINRFVYGVQVGHQRPEDVDHQRQQSELVCIHPLSMSPIFCIKRPCSTGTLSWQKPMPPKSRGKLSPASSSKETLQASRCDIRPRTLSRVLCFDSLVLFQVGKKEMNMGQRCSDTRGITFEDVVVRHALPSLSFCNILRRCRKRTCLVRWDRASRLRWKRLTSRGLWWALERWA